MHCQIGSWHQWILQGNPHPALEPFRSEAAQNCSHSEDDVVKHVARHAIIGALEQHPQKHWGPLVEELKDLRGRAGKMLVHEAKESERGAGGKALTASQAQRNQDVLVALAQLVPVGRIDVSRTRRAHERTGGCRYARIQSVHRPRLLTHVSNLPRAGPD
eukprot:scaffold1355_cov268-Pinguiococcus_pyrenoidosus.AAC.88